MRILMFGWEFPPHISGGLGTACHGLTRALDQIGAEVIFVLPRAPQKLRREQATLPRTVQSEAVTEQFRHVTFKTVEAQLDPYAPAQPPAIRRSVWESGQHDVQTADTSAAPLATRCVYFDIFHEVKRYAEQATELAKDQVFDVIHAHDWMTYPAAMAAAATMGRPFVAHVHSTEFDRAGSNADGRIVEIERRGLRAASRVIAVSRMTRDVIVQNYGIDPRDIEVVYNAADRTAGGKVKIDRYSLSHDEKIVLFLGRLTQQKGPEYFLLAARKVLEVMPAVRFVMAGTGDMSDAMVRLAADMQIGHKVIFTGFLQGLDVERMFRMADLYVMPSVSEPFGISTLEALQNDVPAIISKQSGVGEVLHGALKVDFWDTPEMANKIVAVLRHPPLATMLRQGGADDAKKLSWNAAAERCIMIYESVQNSAAGVPADEN